MGHLSKVVQFPRALRAGTQSRRACAAYPKHFDSYVVEVKTPPNSLCILDLFPPVPNCPSTKRSKNTCDEILKP
uniref:Uncharacterized protein n=1 Tax=Candidatus Kentrum sp. SD TaxID=2126332 RepID=A0A450Z428_9GAMM|nr:MAG: hypothetical protein BECKSD772F_GA0070984_10163 [Candidatus Kentron sp. SD]VFK48547.1 MAG: hypothetical protein BECKSD772E_GA0070983_11304 [Candidatus Kentron sp. SD]